MAGGVATVSWHNVLWTCLNNQPEVFGENTHFTTWLPAGRLVKRDADALPSSANLGSPASASARRVCPSCLPCDLRGGSLMHDRGHARPGHSLALHLGGLRKAISRPVDVKHFPPERRGGAASGPLAAACASPSTGPAAQNCSAADLGLVLATAMCVLCRCNY